MLHLFKLSSLLLLSLLVSCSDGEEDSLVSGCGIDQQNKFVHDVMLDDYLWYQEVEPQIDYADFDSPQQTLDFLRYDVYDPPNGFSYITSAAAFDSLYNAGQYVGYGFSPILLASDDTAWIRYVFDGSPAQLEGLQRGDQILAVNGVAVADISIEDWAGIFGPDEIGYPIDLDVLKPNSDLVQVRGMEKALININTVLHQEILSNGSEDIGYLVFHSFLSTSLDELDDAFEFFSSNGVTKLILDLRYNGGGSVAVANELASYLQAVNVANQDLFSSLVYNDKNQSNNQDYYLRPLSDTLDLDQLIVITTAATCSASELIINGLDPYLDVRTVGSTTCGKPVGMNAYRFCDKMLLPVTFAAENRDGVGEYFAGLSADCPAVENLAVDFGDVADPMLAEALYVSANDVCQPLSARSSQQSYKGVYRPNSLRAVIGAY